MPSLDDLKKRITSVKSTQKITKAMKMVAAAKLRRAQESAEKGRPYSEKMNNIILNLSTNISDKENSPKLLVGTGEDKVHLCIVMTSDRGLCGGFNTNIIKKAKSYFQKILDEEKKNGMPNDISDKVKKEFENRYEKINWIKHCDSLPFNESALALYEWSPIAEELKTLDKKIVLNSMILKWDNIAKEFQNLINF